MIAKQLAIGFPLDLRKCPDEGTASDNLHILPAVTHLGWWFQSENRRQGINTFSCRFPEEWTDHSGSVGSGIVWITSECLNSSLVLITTVLKELAKLAGTGFQNSVAEESGDVFRRTYRRRVCWNVLSRGHIAHESPCRFLKFLDSTFHDISVLRSWDTKGGGQYELGSYIVFTSEDISQLGTTIIPRLRAGIKLAIFVLRGGTEIQTGPFLKLFNRVKPCVDPTLDFSDDTTTEVCALLCRGIVCCVLPSPSNGHWAASLIGKSVNYWPSLFIRGVDRDIRIPTHFVSLTADVTESRRIQWSNLKRLTDPAITRIGAERRFPKVTALRFIHYGADSISVLATWLSDFYIIITTGIFLYEVSTTEFLEQDTLDSPTSTVTSRPKRLHPEIKT